MFVEWKIASILLFHLIKFGFQTQCTVTIENRPFTDCDGTYWTGVTFYFGRQTFFKPMDEVCGKGKKSFNVNIDDTAPIRSGRMSLKLNEVVYSPKRANISFWYVQKISINSTNFKTDIGIGRILDAERIHMIFNFDTMVQTPNFMEDQRIQDLTIHRLFNDKIQIFGTGPLVIKGLNKESFFETMQQHASKAYLRMELKTAQKILFTGVTDMEFSSFEEMENFWKKPGVPLTLRTSKTDGYWYDDVWFGAQRLQGLNPHIIKLVKNIPSTFNIDDNRINSLIEERGIKQALKRNKIFLADLHMLEGLNTTSIWAPMALFYMRKTTIVPIAIQLTRNARKDDVFYRDDSHAWLLAKIYFNCAESIELSMVRHLGHTHLLLDNVAVAMHRYLPPNHPIFKLLKPHFYAMPGRNFLGVFALLSPGQLIDTNQQGGRIESFKLVTKTMKQLDYHEINPIIDIHRRQVGRNHIKVFPVRDRGHDIYKVLRRYVTGIVGNYYGQTRNIVKDKCLRKFRMNLSLSPKYMGLGWKNLPGSDATGKMNKNQLIDILTTVIYQATAGHAIVNDPSFDVFSMPLNYAAKIRKPVPSAKDSDRIDEKYIMECVINKKDMFTVGANFKDLASSVGLPFGQLETQLLFSSKDQLVYKRLQKDLYKLKMKKYKDVDRRFPYKFLNIETIRNSVRA